MGGPASTGLGGSTPRLPRRARRAQLMSLADELFLAEGFAAVSMDDLAARSGVSKPVIYDHFGSKDGLFRAVLDEHAAVLATSVAVAVSRVRGAEARFRAGTLAFFAWVDDRGAGVTVVLDGVGNGADVDHQLRVLRRIHVAQLSGILAETLRQAGVVVTAAIETELAAVAEMLAGSYEALALWWQRDLPHLGSSEVSDRFHRVVWPGLAATLTALARSGA
jgi:AcrR family transcriptional regulator